MKSKIKVADLAKALQGIETDRQLTKEIVEDALKAVSYTHLPAANDDAIACLRCGKCSDHCPSGLQPVRITAALKANDVDEMSKRGVMSCIECGMCTYICPSHIDVTENVRKAKRIVMLKKK